VVSVPLVSTKKDAKLDKATDQNEPKPAEQDDLNQATKENIADVLALLGGHEGPRDRLRRALGPDGSIVDQLRRATPDDLVIIGFSGHGWANPQGRFYLLPSNSGTEAPSEKDGADNAAILSKFISSEELSQWLKDVDAGELAMIIDACHSAASVDQPGFKPGPMGDRGLGQLAYDKGMRILAATQADNVALESEKLGQGLLTYALIDEGLKDHKAAPDGKGPITIGAWLRYAEQRVPHLYDDIRANRIPAAKVVAANDASRSITKEPIVDPAFRDQIAKHAQTPQLFDFYKLKDGTVVGKE
jgi:Caspase domain